MGSDVDRNAIVHKNNRKFPNDDYTKSECLSNARYAMGIARKFGGIFYISPFDLVQVKMSEITMSFVMCIMVLILTKQQKNKKRSSGKGIIVEQLNSHLDHEINDENIQKNARHSKTRSVLQDFGLVGN